MPRTKVDTKRIALYLTSDAVELLGRLAPSENKRGQYVSELIFRAAQERGLIESQESNLGDRIAALQHELDQLKSEVRKQG